jgi:hypothetical protein
MKIAILGTGMVGNALPRNSFNSDGWGSRQMKG